jgi:hypothetical protein
MQEVGVGIGIGLAIGLGLAEGATKALEVAWHRSSGAHAACNREATRICLADPMPPSREQRGISFQLPALFRE